MDLLLRATCFDVTPVHGVIQETVRELCGTRSSTPDDGDRLEHGGLLFLPAPNMWIESRPGDAETQFGALLTHVEDQIGFIAINHTSALLIGFIELQPDDEHFAVRADAHFHGGAPAATEAAAKVGAFVGASLLLINAPVGVERTTEPVHKGFARDMRRSVGFTGLKPWHTIRLSKHVRDVAPEGPGGGTPKAFHFCRSHVRRLPAGGTTRVRAHWRGDPSLGICQADYRMTA